MKLAGEACKARCWSQQVAKPPRGNAGAPPLGYFTLFCTFSPITCVTCTYLHSTSLRDMRIDFMNESSVSANLSTCPLLKKIASCPAHYQAWRNQTIKTFAKFFKRYPFCGRHGLTELPCHMNLVWSSWLVLPSIWRRGSSILKAKLAILLTSMPRQLTSVWMDDWKHRLYWTLCTLGRDNSKFTLIDLLVRFGRKSTWHAVLCPGLSNFLLERDGFTWMFYSPHTRAQELSIVQSKMQELQETQTLLDAVLPLSIDADKWGHLWIALVWASLKICLVWIPECEVSIESIVLKDQ